MSKIQCLAYIVAEATDMGPWMRFATEVTGMQATKSPLGVLDIKMDHRDFRIQVVQGITDAYRVSGWEVADADAFASVYAALEKAGVAVTRGDAARKAQRRVDDLLQFVDPAGNAHEVVYGYTGGNVALISPCGVQGFKTGAQGLGHTVLPALAFDQTLAFFRDVLGFGLTDVFDFQPGPDAPVVRIRFLHAASGRHHSLALAEMPSPSGCVHLMVEVNSMTDVGLAYDRTAKAGVQLMATLGEHENDRMTSFYMMTPGNFAMEYGWGGITVDPATWETTQTRQVSIWGHDFSVGFR
jgi:3,4-dihydroxy-9,10-secoandrosta-1,3,5(10)-triene-9,17-dione 4,5-dioxygenase